MAKLTFELQQVKLLPPLDKPQVANLTKFLRLNAASIADPFLPNKVEPGQLFYAWLRPESTQKLWHEWTHRELDR